MNLKKKINFFLIVFAALCNITIASLAESSEEKAIKSDKNWSLAIKGGITLNAGNTKSQLINGGVEFYLKKKGVEFLTNFEAFYGSSKEEQTVNKGKWFNEFVNKKLKYFNLYGTFTLEYDIFAKIALRGSGGAGIQYSFSDTPKVKVKLAGGINGEFTNGLEDIENIRSMRLNLHYTQAKIFSKTAKYAMDILYTSNFGHFFSDFRIEASLSVSVVLKNPFSLKVAIYEKYTNQPLEDNLEKNDFILVTSLEIAL